MLAPSEQYKAGVKPIENSNRIASIALALALVAFVSVRVFLCVCVKSVTNEASGIFCLHWLQKLWKCRKTEQERNAAMND